MRTVRTEARIRSLITLGIFFNLAIGLQAQNLSTVCFKSLSDYSLPVGANPFSVTTGDLNGDGKKDLAAANLGDGTVKVLFGAPNRGFTDGPNINVGATPWMVLAVDVDGDGDLDLATLRTNSVSVALNDSHGVFGALKVLAIDDAFRMASGDFNGDLKADLVTSGDGGLHVHISNGDGTFTTSAQSLEAANTGNVNVVDFNNDGKKDVVFVTGAIVKMYTGAGNGTFTLKDSETLPDLISEFGCGDVNDDGKMDVLVVANGTHLVASDGNGNFGTASAFAHQIYYTPIIIDVDGDTENDIVVPNIPGASVLIYKGEGGGTYDAPETHLVAAFDLAIADMDGDGKKDIVAADPTEITGGVSVLFAESSSFNEMKSIFAAGDVKDSFTTDLNGDGKVDLVLIDIEHIFVYLNTPTGYIAPVTYDLSDTGGSLEKGDFNGDAAVDMAVTLFTGKVSVWLNDGDGGFTEGGQYNCGDGGDITTIDLNSDNFLDLAVTVRGDNKVAILIGSGTGTFALPSLISVGNLPTSIASGDINSDDHNDLVVGNEGNDKVSLLLGNGNGTFAAPIDLVGGSLVDNRVSLADLNNDGLPELITLGVHQVSSEDPGYIAVRRNLGNGFAARVERACLGGRKGIGYGDFNGDGRLDIAVAGYSSESIGVLTGDGNAGLNPAVVFSTGIGVIAATGDVNNDGAIDIMAVSGNDLALLVLENTTARAVATGPTTFCTGSVTLNANNNATFYEWTGGPNTSMNSSIVASSRGIYTVTASNYSGRCATSSTILVNGPPQTPETDSHDPTCLDPVASITVVMQDDADSYSFDNGETYQTSNELSSLAEGTYHVIIKSNNGCTSPATDVAIAPPPAAPPLAQAEIIDPTCEVATGSINITVIESTDTYSFDGGDTFIADHFYGNLPPGLYEVVVKGAGGCKSGVADMTVNEGPPIPESLSVLTVDPTCTAQTGSISVIAQKDGDTYSFNNGETFQDSNNKDGLESGVYQVIIKNQEGCNSEVTETVIYPMPYVPTAPVTQVVDPTCSEATGSISIVFQSDLEEYSFDNGQTFQVTNEQNGLTPGVYSIVIKSGDECTSPVSSVTVKTQPPTPGKPEVTATTQSNGNVVLQTTAPAAEYHWLKAGDPIADASASSYTATVSGTYQVLIVSTEGCSSKPSDAMAVIVVGDIYEGGSVASRSYPNPATTTLYYSAETSNARGTIFSTSGAEINISASRTGDQLVFDVTGLSPGLYLLKVDEDGAVKTIRWVKR